MSRAAETERPLVEAGPSATLGKLLVVETDAKHLRKLSKTLKAIVGAVDSRSALGELPSDGEYDLLVVNYDGLTAEERGILLETFGRGSGSKTRLLLFSDGNYRSDLVELFAGHSLTNLVAKSDVEVDPEELIVTTRKILQKDIFGIEKYFIWGVNPIAVAIRETQDKQRVLTLVEEYAKNIGVNPRFVAQLRAVADEFVTNALYNAPVDRSGQHRFARTSRSEVVRLEPEEDVQLKLCCDGRRIGISISDPFGSLTMETVLDYLAKCMRKGDDQVDEKQGGAGLGFYYIFDALSHFIVNLSPGKRTEMVGIIDVSGTYREFTSRPKSFNLFVSHEP